MSEGGIAQFLDNVPAVRIPQEMDKGALEGSGESTSTVRLGKSVKELHLRGQQNRAADRGLREVRSRESFRQGGTGKKEKIGDQHVTGSAYCLRMSMEMIQ